MGRKRAGWVPIPGGDMVGLTEPTFVKRWGYKVDRDTVLDKLMKEACADENSKSTIFLGAENPHLTIAQRHPLFKKYWELMPGAFHLILDSLKVSEEGRKIDFHVEDKLLYDIHWKVVEHFVQQVVRGEMDKVQERKLWTGSFYDFTNDSIRNTTPELWRGPWNVLYRRIVKTGTYYPATGYDEDCDPACLAEEKTHVLYWLEHAERAKHQITSDYGWMHEPYFVEKSNTHDWACEKTARILMGVPT